MLVRIIGPTLRTAGIVSIAAMIGLAIVPLTAFNQQKNDNTSSQAVNGQLLFRTHCASCHGEQGDGNGIAAKFLYPRPRDFTAAEFRLTSTTNLVPTDDDLMQVITRGMPGSAMVPFGHLAENERKALVAYVQELTREGMIRKAVQDAKGRGDTPDEAALRQEITEFLKPGAKLELPTEWQKADKASIDRGLALYTTNCSTCHGATGKGDGAQDQKDVNGMPTRPRDFSRGIFKGGSEREQLYARIALGMKGTPMPGSTQLKPNEVGDMINYILSLAPPGAQAKVEHRRQSINAQRVNALPVEANMVWDSRVTSIPIVVSPLWWRESPDPEFRIRAIHDGKTIAFQLTWLDETRDDTIAKVEQFEDMAAVQLFRGQPEPFLGMGAQGAAIDLWLWRASWNRLKEETVALDDYPFDTPFYRDRFAGKTMPDFATARVAGNPHAHADSNQSASNIAASGVGSVTFRPKTSQFVSAKSNWDKGRWVVEFRRPLVVPAEGGVSLKSGEKVSIAFAVWDGAVRDRNGQKQISIWHDLRLE